MLTFFLWKLIDFEAHRDAFIKKKGNLLIIKEAQQTIKRHSDRLRENHGEVTVRRLRRLQNVPESIGFFQRWTKCSKFYGAWTDRPRENYGEENVRRLIRLQNVPESIGFLQRRTECSTFYGAWNGEYTTSGKGILEELLRVHFPGSEIIMGTFWTMGRLWNGVSEM